MKRFFYPVLLVCISVLIFNCQKEISFTATTANNEPVTATLQGNVVDENDNPSQGVTVTVGSKMAVTDARGYFRIRNASLDKSASLVIAEKAGYFKAFRVFSASKAVNHVKIKLLKKTLTGSVNATGGGVITLSNGSSINFSANSFSKASGGSYSGTVNVYAAYIDPSANDIGETVPGSFLGNDKDNKRVILTSYGMMAVELESTAGEKLQIAAGHTAKLSFSIPSVAQSSAPNSIALWYVDEKTGLWKEEGSAIKNGNLYEGDVKHFTYWNCDYPGPKVNLTATFLDQYGQPLVYALVQIWMPSPGNGIAHGYTDSLGQINGPIPANSNLVMDVMTNSPNYSIIYSQNIGPYSSNVNLGTIIINNNQSMISVEGTLLNCSGNPVSNGYAIIDFNNTTRYVSVNASGHFASTLLVCGSCPATCTVTGVDIIGQQQSQPATVQLTPPITQTGNIAACGTSSAQYINYTFDGTNYVLSSAVLQDSFYSSTYNQGGSPYYTTIQGNNFPANKYVSISFQSPAMVPATYTLTTMHAQYFYGGQILTPSEVNLAAFPVASGGFYEGNFSGSFKDSSNVNITHTLSGTFRVRRY